ncbi:U6 snRNA-associated Sm-like protein LSm1 [Microdochium nivale]|nr:U6 snRNA-associated Sm-like protein LSm1 [Microdochium nivale]
MDNPQAHHHDNGPPPPHAGGGGAGGPIPQRPPPQLQQQQALGRGAAPQPQSQQLPPQMFTTAAQLLDLTDKKLLVILRDGRKLTGILRSWDQFANLVLQSTVERIFAHTSEPDAPQPQGYYADEAHGIYLVRGENVLLLGEIDLDKDDDVPAGFEKGEFKTVQKLAKERKVADKARDTGRLKKLASLGFEGENMGEIIL